MGEARKGLVLGGVVVVGSAVALSLGIWVGSAARNKDIRARQAENQARLERELKVIAGSIESELRSLDERLRAQVPAPAAGTGAYSARLRRMSVSARAPFRLEPGSVRGLSPWGNRHELEDFFLKTVAAHAQNREPSDDPVFLRVKPDTASTREWLCVYFVRGMTVDLAVIEPQSAFQVFRSLGAEWRAYLVHGADGTVFAHSQPGLVGSILDRSGKSVPDLSASVALGSTGWSVGLSQPVSAESLETTSDRVIELMGRLLESIALPLGALLALVGFGAALGRVIRTRLERRDATASEVAQNTASASTNGTENGADAQVVSAEDPRILKLEPVAQVVALDNPFGRTNAASSDFMPMDFSISGPNPSASPSSSPSFLHLEEQALIDEFEDDAFRHRDMRKVAQKLSETTQKVAKAPVLFFAYQEALASGVLQASAGFSDVDRPTHLSFPIGPDVVPQWGSRAMRENRVDVRDYEPLQSLIMSKMGVAVFDAFAVTGFGHLGRQAGRPKLLGVLVILQSSVDSEERKQVMKRLVRSTGLIYENTLLSQI